MIEWEYLQHDKEWPRVAGETASLVNEWDVLELGRNGWELVACVRTPSGTLTSLFKRPKLPAAPVPEIKIKQKKGTTA